jgi:hypothetical protein
VVCYNSSMNKNNTCFIHKGIAEMASNLHRGNFKKHPPPQRWKSRCASASSQEDAATSTSTTALNENRRQEVTTTLAGSHIINLAAFVNNVSVHSPSCQQGTISMIGEKSGNGLASVLSAVAAVG